MDAEPLEAVTAKEAAAMALAGEAGTACTVVVAAVAAAAVMVAEGMEAVVKAAVVQEEEAEEQVMEVAQEVEAQEWVKGAAVVVVLMAAAAETMAMALWAVLVESVAMGQQAASAAAVVVEMGTRNRKHLQLEPARALDSTNEMQLQSLRTHRRRLGVQHRTCHPSLLEAMGAKTSPIALHFVLVAVPSSWHPFFIDSSSSRLNTMLHGKYYVVEKLLTRTCSMTVRHTSAAFFFDSCRTCERPMDLFLV